MKKYLIRYSRVSTTIQAKAGGLTQQALEQEQAIQSLIENHGLTEYSESFVDAGVSAFKVSSTDRPNLKKLFDLLDSGAIHEDSILVISNLDRVSRELPMVAVHTLLSLLMKCRIYITQTGKLYDATKDPDSQTFALMEAVIVAGRSHEESATKSKRKHNNIMERINDFMTGKRGATGKPLVIPTGKKPIWCNQTSVDHEVTNDPIKVAIIRDIAKRLTQGNNVTEVHEWVAQSHPDFKISEQSIRRLSNQRSLIGELSVTVQGTTHVLENYFEPVLTESEFYQLVNARNRRNAKPLTKSGNVSIFTGYKKSHCRSCGEVLVTVSERHQTVIRCRGSRGLVKCQNPVSIRSSYVVDALSNLNLSRLESVEETAPNKVLVELESKLLSEQVKYDKIKAMFDEDPDPDVKLAMVSKRNLVESLKNEIESLKIQNLRSEISILESFPTDPIELRDYLKQVLESFKLHKIKRGHVLVSLTLVNGFQTNLYVKNGELVKVGLLTGSNKREKLLKHDRVFKKFITTSKFKKWIEL
ncbi:recombinase family protein [Vibrio ouci]|uniref:recombinase family protein n=1 Tax=Vibrio ouci TaxID=2499078 RepID=UPI00142DCA56|nr:recombinase family protein [Vibrio ouci]